MAGQQVALSALLLLAVWAIFSPLYDFLRDPKKLRRFPGISIAPSFRRTRTLAVHKAHLQHGKAVRVGPTHVSFATVEAIRDIYGHGTMAMKDNFYGAFVSTHLNVSDAQTKSVHNVKRKRFAVAFAQKSIVELESIVHDHLVRLIRILDNKKGQEVDMKQMMLYLMYNVISVTMFNQDPQFLERDSTVVTAETISGEKYEADLHRTLCGSLHMSVSVGWAPKCIPWIKFLTRWHDEWKDSDRIRDITIHFVRNRLRQDTDRVRAGQEPLDDFMTTLLWDKNNNPLCLEFGELVTEAQNLFNAAGENTEIALTNILWLLMRTPRVVEKLRRELNDALPGGLNATGIPSYEQIKDLPYLRACIDEGLRLRPSLPGGLPRIVPKGGMQVSGEWFDEGTTISVSTHTVHRDPVIFHEDPEEYVPERWLQPGGSTLQRAFLAFSQGGRGCLGRNIAYFEMQLVVAALFLRYDFSLRSKDWELGVNETFSAHTAPLPATVVGRYASKR
ncbi:cytochrome P450 [Penicillium lagena]|uniref:cytochrome P450 n=1 Tax=Penicillium lagena TaxID=94218 RepID=UPI00253FAB37|nr:cytochrome P450 [Penicillium lagena]KAJ5610020.1 cytochrome P450 [Penicillium lagena]